MLLLCFFFAFSARATRPQEHSPALLFHRTTPGRAAKQQVRRHLLSEYRLWKGVKYRWGGSGKTGIDCSALMQKIFSHGLAKHLPRTTGEQIQEGHAVTVGELLPGDLIFFRTKPHLRHVGVYVGARRFIHASSRKGVTISSLENHYWVMRFEMARRVVE
ncbi:C40 family peptidase [Klebsiella aerogenes]|nr:C40 family peptidase [Klebsiella aerogenes]ELY3087839.1 C40 family peptidase [Klebsiella aerogenes]